MCGISGFNCAPSSIKPNDFAEGSVKALSHRGPDDNGIFLDEHRGVSLVHTRLSIIDTSRTGHQPMISDDERVVLAFNGEIYNFQDLRVDLESDGYIFKGSSDTEVLLNLYLQLRKKRSAQFSNSELSNMLKKLNGIFSFAIWDADRNSTLLVRDAFGVKPLYFTKEDSCILFTSEAKVFRNRPLTINPSALDRYLAFLWCPGNTTAAHEISKLGPGEAMWISNGQAQAPFTWFRLPTFKASTFASKTLSLSQSVFGVDQLLRQAVHRQMAADVPLGAFLSGGLDSSSIAALARERDSNLRCFTIDVAGNRGDGFSDDLPYARRVARHLGLSLDVVSVDAARMASNFEEMVLQLDEPLADPAPLNVLYISRFARDQGFKVLLSGAGGDDLFSGYRRHLALENEKWWRWLPRTLRLQLRSLTGNLPTNHPFTRRVRKAFSGAHLEGDARLVHYFRWIERSDLEGLYSQEFRSSLGRARAEDAMLKYLSTLPSDTPALERMLALEQRFFLTDHNLTYTDKMSMAVGVEVRVPFLDLDLVEFAARIPPYFKQRGRHGKWILKKAMEPYLPKEVIYRPKAGFGVPLRRWLNFELRDWLSDTLSHDRLQRRGLFDPNAVQSLIDANADGRIDASYTLLSLACIEIWCKYFLDGAPSPSLDIAGR